MTREEAIKKYGKKNPVIYDYVDADEFFWQNDHDPDLQRFKVKLPEPPDWKEIDGFGLPIKDQFFKKQTEPKKLEELVLDIRARVYAREKRSSFSLKERMCINETWLELKEKNQEYKKELKWIKKQWHYRLHGYWFFNKGKPTYLDGSHFLFLNFWTLHRTDKVEYRDRDRRWFLTVNYLITTTEAPKMFMDKEENMHPVLDENEDVIMEEKGVRTCLGANISKRRRCGDTSKANTKMTDTITSSLDAQGGIQADVGDKGEEIFLKHIIYPFKKLPFFFMPLADDYDPKKKLLFQVTGHTDLDGSVIDFAESALSSAYDGATLSVYLGDEIGKTKEDIVNRNEVVRECLTQGSLIKGYAIYTTTVEEISSDSIMDYYRFCAGSHFEQRNTIGQTRTGVVNTFFRASDGLDGFVDKYGYSIEGDPTEEQAQFLKDSKVAIIVNDRVIGAKEYLESRRTAYRVANEERSLNGYKRKFPLRFREVFTPPVENTFFPTERIELRWKQLFNNTDVIRGNMQWTKKANVEFVPDIDGRFEISLKLSPAELNKKVRINGIYYPEDEDSFVACADAFRYDETSGSRMSNGGGAVLWVRDETIDPENKDITKWESERFVCTYSYRPDDRREFCDDMLKMCVYFGAKMYPEMNLEDVYNYFLDMGYDGYLLHDIDVQTGKPKSKPGFYTGGQGKIKDKIFTYTRDHLVKHVNRCMHQDYLRECLDIRGKDDMKNYDLFTACGGCLLGARNMYISYSMNKKSNEMDKINISGLKNLIPK